MDTWLGRFLDRLAELGMDDNTLVVLISDHGVLLGEYGWVGKRYSEMHKELCHVPFVIRHPARQGQGHTSRYCASTTTWARPCSAVLGYERPMRMNGADLSPLLDGQAAGPEAHLPHRRLQRPRGRPRRPLAADRRQPGRGEAPLRAGNEGTQRGGAPPAAGAPALGLHQAGRRAQGPAALQVALRSQPRPRPRCGPAGRPGRRPSRSGRPRATKVRRL